MTFLHLGKDFIMAVVHCPVLEDGVNVLPRGYLSSLLVILFLLPCSPKLTAGQLHGMDMLHIRGDVPPFLFSE